MRGQDVRGGGSLNAPAGAAAPRAGTRRRGDDLRTAILGAALGQLREHGYTGLTMEGVAAAARTGKAALYRRWDNKDALVEDALASALPAPAELPLTGDTRADLLLLLRAVADGFALSRDAAFRAAGRGAGAHAVTLVHDRVVVPAQARVRDLVRAGVAAGRFRPGADNARTAAVGPAMLVLRFVTEGPDVPDGYLEQVVDDVVLPLLAL
ncbi:TetR/AcrR family transcriptional regulator [Streptomyces sp. NPDC049879]|uniref:TetR/AcrR family transcriptional regulator n=1 Tax=Streptomyces sp. NPDC049879 TaxID=3365598 RepID=UPI00379BC9B2